MAPRTPAASQPTAHATTRTAHPPEPAHPGKKDQPPTHHKTPPSPQAGERGQGGSSRPSTTGSTRPARHGEREHGPSRPPTKSSTIRPCWSIVRSTTKTVIRRLIITGRKATEPTSARVRTKDRRLIPPQSRRGAAGSSQIGPVRRPKSMRRVRMAPQDPRQTKFVLDESRIPRAWYNIAADLPVPPSPYSPSGYARPLGPDDLAPLFPMALIGQEVSAEREIEIPEPVRDAYRLYRPSPLFRAHRLDASSIRRPTSTTSTRAAARPAATSRTRPSPRPSTTRNRASSAWRPRRAPASGGVPWPLPARCSASRSRSTWSAPATTRSRTGGS